MAEVAASVSATASAPAPAPAPTTATTSLHVTSRLSSLPHLNSYQAWVLGGAAALVPLVLQKTLKGLSLIAASGLLVLCVGIAAVTASGVIQFGGFPAFPSPLAAPPSPSHFAAFFGIAAFSFGGSQVTVLPVQDGMQRPERAGAPRPCRHIAGHRA